MISDCGAELLLMAIYQQARLDVEEVFASVVRLQKACERGKLARFLAEKGWLLAGEEERTAVWWFAGRRLPPEMAAMVKAIGEYERHCRYCRAAGRGTDGRLVQR